MNTGTCKAEGGYSFTVVNKDDTLRLRELKATLDGVRTADFVRNPVLGSTETPQGGLFAIFDVTITSKLHYPIDMSITDMAGLRVGKDQFNPSFDTVPKPPRARS